MFFNRLVQCLFSYSGLIFNSYLELGLRKQVKKYVDKMLIRFNKFIKLKCHREKHEILTTFRLLFLKNGISRLSSEGYLHCYGSIATDEGIRGGWD